MRTIKHKGACQEELQSAVEIGMAQLEIPSFPTEYIIF
jgi:hypothetical protein